MAKRLLQSDEDILATLDDVSSDFSDETDIEISDDEDCSDSYVHRNYLEEDQQADRPTESGNDQVVITLTEASIIPDPNRETVSQPKAENAKEVVE